MKDEVVSFILPPSSFLLGFLVSRVLAATAAELTKLKTLRGRLLILRRHVITTLAIRALKHNIIARHKSPSKLEQTWNRWLAISPSKSILTPQPQRQCQHQQSCPLHE